MGSNLPLFTLWNCVLVDECIALLRHNYGALAWPWTGNFVPPSWRPNVQNCCLHMLSLHCALWCVIAVHKDVNSTLTPFLICVHCTVQRPLREEFPAPWRWHLAHFWAQLPRVRHPGRSVWTMPPPLTLLPDRQCHHCCRCYHRRRQHSFRLCCLHSVASWVRSPGVSVWIRRYWFIRQSSTIIVISDNCDAD